MKPSQINDLPAMLRALAESIDALPDFANLPRVYDLKVEWDDEADTLKISAQHFTRGDDFQIITNLNTWASALGGVLLLGDEARTSAAYGYYWRKLSARAALPGGLLVEVWDHLNYPIPADAPAPELIAA